MSSGTGERLGGTWYLSLDGIASTRISASATAEDVSNAIANLTAAGNVTVTDGIEDEGYNGERSWVVTFHDWNNPNRTAMPPALTVGDLGLTGTGAAVRLKTVGLTFVTSSDGELIVSDLCTKAVVTLSSLLSAGDIDECVFVAAWHGGSGGNTYNVPTFAYNANSSVLETALGNVDETVLGEVWVSREGTTGGGGGIWNITFIENTEGRVPELQCGSDADVSQTANATCDAVDGVFVLEFDGNATQEIPYNASALEVRGYQMELCYYCSAGLHTPYVCNGWKIPHAASLISVQSTYRFGKVCR